MKISIWAISLGVIGALLSLKDANWLGNPNFGTLTVLVVGATIGVTIGVCIGLVARPAKSETDRRLKFLLWICVFALLGVILGHGNVPWRRTFAIIGWSVLIGAGVGIVHYFAAGPNARR